MMGIKDFWAKVPVEYSLGFVSGGWGAGKTAFLAWLGWSMRHGYSKIYANFHLDLPNAVFLSEVSREVILSLDRGSLLLLQEAHFYFDKRWSGVKANKEIFQAVMQIRKIGVDVFVDIKDLFFLDFRVVDREALFLGMEREFVYYPGWFGFTVYELVSPENLRAGVDVDFTPLYPAAVDLSPVFRLYDTVELVQR